MFAVFYMYVYMYFLIVPYCEKNSRKIFKVCTYM